MHLDWYKTEKLVQELAWRDYWQQVWIAKGNEIFQDLKNDQLLVSNHELPKVVTSANTQIEAIDEAINELYSTGYMHNHMRMYIASICCNIAQSHWLEPSKWMYSNLLDGDLASNNLSWQWVAGSFSNKKYFANQENINRYFNTKQSSTFLDVDYDEFDSINVPNELKNTIAFELKTPLPSTKKLELTKDKTTLIYNYYNLDPYWYSTEDVQRILLLEPSFFDQHPVNQKCIDFMIGLSQNISGIQIYVGSFSDLKENISVKNIIYKEHPTNLHYEGKEEPRDWMGTTQGYFPSFFKFWKKYKKELKAEINPDII